MNLKEYPLKDVRLSQLLEAGINVVDFVCFAPGQLDEEGLRAFFEKYKKISCRHFHADESTHFKCPVKYEQTDWEVIVAFCRENNKKFYTLCNQAVALEDSTFAGNILFHQGDRSYTIEYFEGYGTPRDIEKKSQSEIKVFERVFGEPITEDAPEALKQLAAKLSAFRSLT